MLDIEAIGLLEVLHDRLHCPALINRETVDPCIRKGTDCYISLDLPRTKDAIMTKVILTSILWLPAMLGQKYGTSCACFLYV